jgi:hypothetical protein
MSERDPILALIDRQRRLQAAHERTCRAPEQKREAACRAAGAGLRELVNTAPTTFAA